MPQYIKKNLRAFTLIEVMVVVAIVGILTAAVIVSLANGRTQKELETNAREFAAVVREAQNYALTGKQIGGSTACAFSVIWVAPSTYSLGYTFKNAAGNCVVAASPVASYTLKNGVAFASSGAVIFALPWAVTSIAAAPGYIDITFSKSSTYHVCVYARGKIIDQQNACS